MLARIAHFAVARRRLVLVASVVLFALGGALGGGVAEELSSGGFDDPGSESFQADQTLLETFGTGVPNIVLLVSVPDTPGDVPAVDDPAVQAAGLALTERLASTEHLTNVVSYWSIGNQAPLRSDAGDRALVIGRIAGTQDEVDERIAEIAPEFEGVGAEGLETEVTGYAEIFRQVGHQIETDLVRAEMIALPITLLLLLFIFRSVVAAALPLAIGALAVVNTFLVLRIINSLTEVSVFALNLTTAMGLGLAIDYSLFVVSRFREELDHGHEPHAAVVRTVRTAGRTVAFSAGTVAASLLALLIFPIAFLKSFAYAGVAVAGLAGFFSVVVLPAMLAALGHRVNALPVGRRTPRTKPEEEGFWYRAATRVMHRPGAITAAVIAVLVLGGLPFLSIDLGLPDDRVLPTDAPARAASDVIRDEFTSNEAGASSIVATDIGDTADPAIQAQIDDYARRLSAIDGAERVDALTGIYAGGEQLVGRDALLTAAPALAARFDHPDSLFVSVVPDHEPNSATGEAFVSEIRDLDAPFDVRVTGSSAQLVDSKSALMSRIPLALVMIAGITFVLLFLMFGSIVIPLKALVLNVLSLSATFGAMVWIFQDGNLSGVLDFTATGTIDASTPILMFCVAFGLSMDYEVFLLSRIKEEHDNGADDRRAVALGLERTGRIVTAAALLISVVFLAFGTSQVSFIKLFGIGLALAVLMDAFVIRGTLVPAFMRMAGDANWWAPAPLRRFHDRYGVSEHVELDPAPAVIDLVPPDDPDDRNDRNDTTPRRERPLVAAGRQDPYDPEG